MLGKKGKLHHFWLMYKGEKPKRNTFQSRYKRRGGKVNPDVDAELFKKCIEMPVRFRTSSVPKHKVKFDFTTPKIFNKDNGDIDYGKTIARNLKGSPVGIYKKSIFNL